MPLSTKQMEYLALAWQCFESEPKIDYAHFALIAGLASPHSARELMRVTKKKLKAEYGALGSSEAKKEGTVKKESKSSMAVGRKRKNGDVSVKEEESPAKKGKSSSSSTSTSGGDEVKVKQEEKEEEEEEDQGGVVGEMNGDGEEEEGDEKMFGGFGMFQ